MSNIGFKNVSPVEVLDAFTGGPLEGEVFRCSKCSSCYGIDSLDVLIQQNEGKCMSCENTHFEKVVSQ